jgi:hypothetical protein
MKPSERQDGADAHTPAPTRKDIFFTPRKVQLEEGFEQTADETVLVSPHNQPSLDWVQLGRILRDGAPPAVQSAEEVVRAAVGESRFAALMSTRPAPAEAAPSPEMAAPRKQARKKFRPRLPRLFAGAAANLRTLAMGVVLGAILMVALQAAFGRDSLVLFTVRDSQAFRVSVVGDFNDWAADTDPLKRIPGTDVWEGWIRLGPGVTRYTFLVDGTHRRVDPSRPPVSTDDEGRRVSELRVPPRSLTQLLGLR